MTINELRIKRAKAWEATKAFLDSHRNTDGVLSAEDDATYTRMEQEVADLGKEIARLERQEAVDREMNAPTSQPLTQKPGNAKTDTKTGRAADAYKDAFWNVTRSKEPVSYEVRNALQVGVDTEGGYLVPDEFEHTLVQALGHKRIVRDHAYVFQTNSGSHKIPVVTNKGSAAWVDEEGGIPEGDDTFGQQTIGAHKVGTIIKVSEELLNDSAFDLEGYFTSEFSRRIGNKEEDAFFNGDGVGKPLGLLADKGGAEIGVTAASATTITADEIMNLFYDLEAPYRENAIWVFNDATMGAIRKLKGNDGQYLWQKALHEGDHETLLGKPVFTSPFMPEMKAGLKPVLFGDFNFYWIGDRQGVTFKRLNERYADTGQIGFMATKRVDGKLVLPEAIKALQMKASA
ncbi:MAG: phage major capsid protein [Oscillospiraceae bacterium]|nr:phage major capsid protein [Oscillospiraceae bacterium]